MKKKKLFANIFIFAMIFIMGVGLASPLLVYADTKSDYQEAQDKLNAINKEIAGITSTKKKQEAEKKNAQTQINLVKSQINILNTDIKKQNELLVAKQREVEAKKTDIYNTDELFKERLKAMYVMRSGGTLSAILTVESFSQLMTATDTLQRISVADTELLKNLDAEKKALEEAEAAIQNELNTLVEKQGQLENKQSELAGYMQKINASLSRTQAKEEAAKATQKEVYAEYLAAKQAMDAEFAGSSGEFVGGEWLWPVPGFGHISSGFGPRTLYGAYDYHTGIDIAKGTHSSIDGRTIVAANSGTVTKAVYGERGYGYYIIIDHGGNTYSLYGHCSALLVGVGDYVVQGQAIARVGSTGNSTGPHLHFEIRKNGGAMANVVNPKPLVEASRPAR